MSLGNSIPEIDIVSGSITVWDHQLGSKLYSSGFFGKPLGIRKASAGDDINRPLSLSLFDALYLVQKSIIKLRSEGKILSEDQIIKFSIEMYEDFHKKYKVYKELRDLGYVVRPGMKFGTDFIVYEQGPGLDHSQWAILVEDDDSNLRAINIVRAGRLAHSVKKSFLIATQTEEGHRYFSFSRFKL